MKFIKKFFILVLVSLTLIGPVISANFNNVESTHTLQTADRGGGAGRGNG